MELLLAALPMVGCAVMMALMMRPMRGDRSGHRSEQPPDPTADSRRAALNAEIEELRAQLGERSA